jgi:uncharacterized cupin superfamily protein
MADKRKPVVNVVDVPLNDRNHGKSFASKYGRAGPALGLSSLGCSVTVVPPGKRAFPFHRHHVIEEVFYILSGEGEYRYGAETFPVKTGDIVGAPAGGEAHQLVNTGKSDLLYLGVSTVGSVDVVEYPDSGKIAMAAGIRNADFRTATYAGVGRLDKADYWDGEE